MKDLINKLRQSKILGKIFHTIDYNLQEELLDCESVLDLGCGPSSPLRHCRNIKHSIGVEAFGSYLEKSKEAKIHTEYLKEKIEKVEFPDNSFDAIILIEVLEHLPKDIGLDILKKAEKWAKKKIIVSSPNGFVAQKAVDNNPFQEHLSGWNKKTMKSLGFRVYGLSGLKILRQEVQSETMGDDLTTSIRFRPRTFWFFIATLSQFFTYFIPSLAFGLFSVKKIKK